LAQLKVLYLHATASFGGSSKSLCELLQAMPAATVDATILCPPGTAAEQFRRAGLRVVTVRGVPKWDHTRHSFYRGVRWLLLARELSFLMPTWLALRRLRKTLGRVDVVHVNDITVLAAGAIAMRMFRAPLVVHARSLQNDDARLLRTRLQTRLLRATQAHVIAIDETVRRTLDRSLPVAVVHNGLRMDATAVTPTQDSPRTFRVAIVGVLLRLKGVFEFVEAARLCRERAIAVEFWVVGDNVRDVRGIRGRLLQAFGFAEDVRAGLQVLIRQYNLDDRVKLLGFVADVGSIYRQIDVLCFPSQLDAAGRPVFEAGWYGVPSIVAVRDPLPDTIEDGRSGLCIPESNAAALADAIARLYADRAECRRLGQGARELAQTYFDQRRNSLQVLKIYGSACGRSELSGPARRVESEFFSG
jgi:glycosyltransferase involved in cell wall biosynthesis